MMIGRMICGAAVLASVLLADTVMLRSGRSVEGQFLGGDARRIRVDVGDRIESFDVQEVSEIRFGTSSPARAPEPAKESQTGSVLQPAAPAPPASASAAASPAVDSQMPEGTEVVVRMIDDVDSQRDAVGQIFKASIDQPIVVDGQTLVSRGADVTVKLVADREAGRLSGRTELTLDLVELQVNGRMVPVVSKEVTTQSESRTGRTAKVVGGTTALGAIIGAIAGGGRGAAIGAVSGAAAGGAVQVMTKGPTVKIPSESRLTFILQQPLRP